MGETFNKEDIQAVFLEKNIQFPVEEFIDALKQKETERAAAFAARPITAEIHSEAILEAPTPGTRIEDLIISAVKNNDEGYFDLFYVPDGLDDDGEDETVYYKVGDKYYEVEIHCEAEWVGDWSVRKNLPGNVHVTLVKELKNYNIKKEEEDYILLEITK